MEVTIERVDEKNYNIWDAYVAEHPMGTVFHSTGWLTSISPDSLEVWLGVAEGQILGGVALVKTRKRGLRSYHIPPYTPYFGPVFGKGASISESLTTQHQFIDQLLSHLPHAGHYDFKFVPGHHSVFPFARRGYSCEIVQTHIIDAPAMDYLSLINKNKLRELRKLLRMVEDGTIEISVGFDPDDFMALLRETGKRNHFDVHQEHVLKLLTRGKANLFRSIGIYSKVHGLISAGIFPFDGRTVYNLINVSKKIEDPTLKTVNLLMVFSGIDFALKGKKQFDFEGSMLQGVELFCRLMGGRQVPVYRMQKSTSLYYGCLRALNLILSGRT